MGADFSELDGVRVADATGFLVQGHQVVYAMEGVTFSDGARSTDVSQSSFVADLDLGEVADPADDVYQLVGGAQLVAPAGLATRGGFLEFDLKLPGSEAPLAVEVEVGFELAVVGQHVLPGPAVGPVLHPLVEDRDQEPAELLRRHRAFRHEAAFLLVERAVSALQSAPAAVRERDRVFGRALDDRNELDELRFQLVAKIVVDLERMIDVGRMNGTQDIDVDRVLLQAIPCAQNIVESAGSALVDAIRVVQLARSVDAEADAGPCLRQKCDPRRIQGHTVGLERKARSFRTARREQFIGALIPFDRNRRRLPRVPDDRR